MDFYEDQHSKMSAGEKPALPNNLTPTMAYIPFQQWGSSLNSDDEALKAGTLFPELDKPFEGRGVYQQ